MVSNNLRDRRHRFTEFDEVGAVDVTAMMLAAIADEFQAPEICADRTPREERKRNAGENAKPIEDFVDQCLRWPDRMYLPVAILLEAMGFAPPEYLDDSETDDLPHEMVDVVKSSGALMEQYAADIADGRVDDVDEMLGLLIELERQVTQAKVAARDELAAREDSR
jgi:hypothetical protein